MPGELLVIKAYQINIQQYMVRLHNSHECMQGIKANRQRCHVKTIQGDNLITKKLPTQNSKALHVTSLKMHKQLEPQFTVKKGIAILAWQVIPNADRNSLRNS